MRFKKQKNTETFFAHRTKIWDFDNFYCWMYGVDQPNNEEELKDFEACYFAMCLLLPKELFLQEVGYLGGLKTVLCDNNKMFQLSKKFKVPMSLVKVRISDFIKQHEIIDNNETKKENKHSVKEKVKMKKSIAK